MSTSVNAGSSSKVQRETATEWQSQCQHGKWYLFRENPRVAQFTSVLEVNVTEFQGPQNSDTVKWTQKSLSSTHRHFSLHKKLFTRNKAQLWELGAGGRRGSSVAQNDISAVGDRSSYATHNNNQLIEDTTQLIGVSQQETVAANTTEKHRRSVRWVYCWLLT